MPSIFESTGMTLAVAAGYPESHVLAAATMGLVILALCSAWLSLRPPANLPPGPSGLPLLGCLHLLGTMPHQSLAKLAKQYGPLMSLRLGQVQFIVASSPQAAMEFLKTQDANFCARPPVRAGQVMFGPDILFQSNSAEWRQLKKMFQMGLTGSKRLEATRHMRQDEMAQWLRSLPRNCEFNMRKQLGVLVTGIISRLILNRSFSGLSGCGDNDSPLSPSEQLREIQSFRGIMGSIFKGLSAFYPADFIPAIRWVPACRRLDSRFRDTHERMDALATQIIADHEERRARGPVVEHEKDMLHVLLEEVETYNSITGRSGPHITMANVKGIIWDAFSGGTDTILFTSEWIMSEVVRDPTVQAAAQAELDRVVGRQRRVQEADLADLHYIQAVVKEGLRLHPIAPLMAQHQSLHACQAFGYDIPAGTHLFVNVWAIARDPAVWADPLQFQPERWLDPDEAGCGLVAKPGQFLPFGAGRRMCPGIALGNVVLEYCVASLLQSFEWSVKADPGSVEGPGMGVPRAVALRVTAKPRLSSQVMDS